MTDFPQYLSMQAYKSQYDALLKRETGSKVQTLWLHLLTLYFPHEKGFGLLFQDWPCEGTLDLSIAYLAPCMPDTRDLRHQPKNMFFLISENREHDDNPESIARILKKFAKKMKKLTTKEQENEILCAAVATGTHVRFFWLEVGHEELTEGDFGAYLELSENEGAINVILEQFKYDLVGAWGLD
ncbi:hypothetical protein N7481_002552 [Penicillium waksmanii]|uniref:uncharacterized protein n=1 Tax=Penicillium waksmanii TaxID=69791 RepID=UPI002546FCDA|nr:uncharacterized protein N7481_002552 [Penicillium waksmanii]KAJ5995575.1 hypothetical protein N7481_002552 [Penicillium waksmanii]